MASKVAIVKTRPQTVLQDIQRVMQLAQVKDALQANATTILKNNLSWHLMFPSANTTPWQLEGTILGLRQAGFEDLVCVENETVVTSAKAGEILNKQRPVCDYYGVPIKYNFKPADMKWQRYEPKAKMAVLSEIFTEGIFLGIYLYGWNRVSPVPSALSSIRSIAGSSAIWRTSKLLLSTVNSARMLLSGPLAVMVRFTLRVWFRAAVNSALSAITVSCVLPNPPRSFC